MSPLTLKSADGRSTPVDVAALAGGEVITPDSPKYDEARSVWNGMIDKRPGMIVRCSSTADIVSAVKLAHANGIIVAVKGGGHNIAGNGVCDGGMVIDLSQMRGITVDPTAKTATVQPGVTLGEFDAACQAHALATPVGINSTTGIAGLTLGGGFGWISRKYGLTIDNLIETEVVLATGEVVKASETDSSDLFWGLRGGGGNFGIVSSFKYKLHQVGPEILSGLIVHPMDDAPQALRFYRDFCATLPDDITVWVVMRQAPPLPFLPEKWHGKEVLVMAVCALGDMAAAEAKLKPLREFGNPIADVIGPNPFAGWQQAFDPLLGAGARNYWKTNDFAELTDEIIDSTLESIRPFAAFDCEVFIGQMGGASSRVNADSTAYNGRDAKFIMNVHGRWNTPAEDDKGIAWARGLFKATEKYSTGAAYVNFLTAEEGDRVAQAYGPSYQRLVDLKRKYDPTNLFCTNQNIKP